MKGKEKLTILPRRFGQPHTRQMEPLARTSVIVARDHLAEADLVAIAVPGLALLIFVVALVERLLIGGDSGHWDCGLLRIALGCRVVTSCWPCTRGLGECGEDGR